jgi:hypothetical protein
VDRLWLRATSVYASAQYEVCNVTTIIEKKPSGSDISVILVGEKLGFWKTSPKVTLFIAESF